MVAFVFLAVTLTGCAHPQAKAVAVAPDIPLDVPAPPPRALDPITAEALPQVGPVNEEPSRAVAPRPARPTQPPQAPPRADAAPSSDTPRPADEVPGRPSAPAPAPAPAAPTLQTTPAQQEGEVEARIRGVIARASADLSRIDYGRLNTNLKTQYDLAKRFVSQAEDAIRARNLVYAATLADKAAELAAQMGGR